MKLQLDRKRQWFVTCFRAAAPSQFAQVDKSKSDGKSLFLEDAGRAGAACYFSNAI